jgi:hypothetical protein
MSRLRRKERCFRPSRSVSSNRYTETEEETNLDDKVGIDQMSPTADRHPQRVAFRSRR